MQDAVRLEKLGPVTVVTLDRPEVRNAVDGETARALHEAFLAFDSDGDAKVAVFHGAHGHFCAGWDLQFGAKMARQSPPAQVIADLDFAPGDKNRLGPMGPSRLLLS
jgi:enoyl-CoA hydratase